MEPRALELELTAELRDEQIVAKYIYDFETDSLHLALNSKYKKKVILAPLDPKWPKTIETYIHELKRKSIKEPHLTLLCDCADNNAPKILKWRQTPLHGQ